MATLIGVVSQVIGEVFAVAGNGSRRPLVEGDRVYAGEQLVTGASGAVAIALVGGGELTLGRDSNLMLDTQLLAGARGDGSAAAAQGAESAPSDQDLTEVEQLQAAIAAGVDPTLAGQAPAAGPGAGGAGGAANAGGGHSFVLLGETAGRLDPVIGFPTEGLSSGPEFPDPEIDPDIEVTAEDGVPSGGTASGAVDEDGLPGGIPGGVDDLPGEATTATGSLGYSFGPDGAGSFAWSTAGLPSVTSGGVPLTYSVSADGLTLIASTGDGPVFTLTLTDLATGTYEFNLLAPLDHAEPPPGTSVEDDLDFVFGYTITDSNGTVASGSLGITVDDDSPSASLNEEAPSLGRATVDESLPAFGGVGGDGIASAVLSAAVVQAQFDSAFGADGAGDTTYSLVLSGADVPSGLFAVDPSAPDGKGAQILLSQVDNVITGSAGGVDYFTLTIDPATGEVTLDLLSNIWHSDSDDADDGEVLQLGEGVLMLVQTLTDADGDSDSASIDLGAAGAFSFEDDGPIAGLAEDAPALGSVTVDESLPAPDGQNDGVAQAVLSAAIVQAQFDSAHGADGEGSTVYSLVLNTGDEDSIGSGLFAVDPQAVDGKGAEIQLSQSGNVISGMLGDTTYFTLTIDPDTGAVTLDLLSNIWHSDSDNPDDAEVLQLGEGVLMLVQTLTDADGDSDSASIDLGAAGAFRFEDDAPIAGLAEDAPALGSVTVDESLPAPDGQNDGVVQAVLSAAIVQAQFDSAHGADGEGSTVYSLVLNTGDEDSIGSGLFAVDPQAVDGKGAEIQLSQSGNVISGMLGDTTYFTLTIDPDTGAVTLDLLSNIWHSDSDDADDGEVLQLDEGVLTLVQTLTDADGDSASASIDLGAAGAFRFEDDAPIAGLAEDAPALGSVTVDESLPAPDGQNDGVAQAVLSAAIVQAQFDSAHGADGEGSTVYSLVLNTGDEDSIGSGLFAVDPQAVDGKGAEIQLSQSGNVISGMVGDTTYFTLTIDPDTGEVTLDLLSNIWHSDSDDADDAEVLQLGEGVLMLVQTLTDADGDSDSASIDLGAAGAFSFEDDGPVAGLSDDPQDLGTVTVDESLPALDGAHDDGIAQAVLSAAIVQSQFASVYGADGPGSTVYSFDLDTGDGDSVGSGLYAVDPEAEDGQGAEIQLSQSGNVISGKVGDTTYFTLTIDPDTGAVTLDLLSNIWHSDSDNPDDAEMLQLDTGVLQLVQTLTDADGDSDSAAFDLGAAGVFSFEDDGPIFHSVMDAVLSSATTVAFNGLYNASFGADGLDFLSVALGEGGTYGGESVSFVQSDTAEPGIFKVDVTATDGSNEVLFSFYYTTTTNAVSDSGDGSVEFHAFSSLADPAGSPFFTLTINPDGTYTFEMISNEVISSTTVSGEDFSAFGPIGAVSTDDQSLTISGSDDINASENGIGVFNPQIDEGEWLKIEFAKNQTLVSFTLQQWTGPATAALLMLALDGVAFDFDPEEPGVQNLSVPKGGERITVIVDADLAGTWNYDAATKTYTLYTGTEFNELRLDYVSGAPNFNINNITYDQTITIENLALNFDLAVTDGDGDMSALDNELTIIMLDPDAPVSAAQEGVDAENGVVLVGNGENDILIGGEGDDILIGDDGDDVLIGGLGDDTMTGGAGIDTFLWQSGDTSGTDHITDFFIATPGVAGGDSDVLDLSQLLTGLSGNPDGNELDDYLSFLFGASTTITVDVNGPGAGTAGPTIVLDGVDLSSGAYYGSTDAATVIDGMLGDNALKVDTV